MVIRIDFYIVICNATDKESLMKSLFEIPDIKEVGTYSSGIEGIPDGVYATAKTNTPTAIKIIKRRVRKLKDVREVYTMGPLIPYPKIYRTKRKR